MCDIPPWPVEEIPDDDSLYLRAHKCYFQEGELQPGVFTPHGESISVDWSKYSTPEQTQSRARFPSDNAIVSLIAGQIRAISPMTVFHDPINEMPHPWRAHSGIGGMPEDRELKTQVRVQLLDAISGTTVMFTESAQQPPEGAAPEPA